LRAVYSGNERTLLDAIYGIQKLTVSKLAKDPNIAAYRIVDEIKAIDDTVVAQALFSILVHYIMTRRI